MLPLEPFYPLKYLVLVLIVVALSGAGNVRAALGAAIFVGVVDTAGRFLLPEVGGFVIYVLLIVLVVWRGDGLLSGRRRDDRRSAAVACARARTGFRWGEAAPLRSSSSPAISCFPTISCSAPPSW